MNDVQTIGQTHLFGDEPPLFQRVLAQGRSAITRRWVRAVQSRSERPPLIASSLIFPTKWSQFL